MFNIQFIRNTFGILKNIAHGQTDRHAFSLSYEFVFFQNIQHIEFVGPRRELWFETDFILDVYNV
jgi:hypothetical protein